MSLERMKLTIQIWYAVIVVSTSICMIHYPQHGVCSGHILSNGTILMTLKVSLSVWNFSNSHTSGDAAHLLTMISLHTWIRKCMWPVIFIIMLILRTLTVTGSYIHSEMVQDRETLFSYKPLIGTDIWPIKLSNYHFWWPWVAFKVIHLLQASSNMILTTAVQQLTRFQMTAQSMVPLRQLSFLY